MRVFSSPKTEAFSLRHISQPATLAISGFVFSDIFIFGNFHADIALIFISSILPEDGFMRADASLLSAPPPPHCRHAAPPPLPRHVVSPAAAAAASACASAMPCAAAFATPPLFLLRRFTPIFAMFSLHD